MRSHRDENSYTRTYAFDGNHVAIPVSLNRTTDSISTASSLFNDNFSGTPQVTDTTSTISTASNPVRRHSTLDLLIRASNQHLDSLSLLRLLERLQRLLKRHSLGDELLGVDLAARHQLHGELVVAAAVPEASVGGGLLDGERHDGECDVCLAHAALDVVAAVLEDVHRSLDAGLGARGVDDDVGALGEPALALDVVRVLLGRHALRQVRVRGGEPLGELELGGDDVDAHDRRGAKGLGHGGAEQTHGTRAHDDDGLARVQLCHAGDVHADGEGLDEGALLQGHVVGQLVAEVLRGGPEAGQGAVDGRGGGELHLGAEVVLAGQAAGAAAAGVARLDGDAVADLEGGDGVADLGDDAGGLVAQDHGLGQGELADAAMLPVVHV